MTIYVCHIATMTNWGGVERIVQDYLTTNQDSDIKNFLICSSYKEEVIEPLLNSNIQVFLPRRLFRYDITVLFKMAVWIKRNNIHLLHSYNNFSNNVANLLSIMTGIPLICSEHGTVWETKGLRKILDRFAYHRARAITANTSASKLLLIKRYNVRDDKIIILKNPVPKKEIAESSDEIRKEFSFPQNEILVGTVARLVPLKRIDIFIRAAYEVLKVRRDITFVIVGGGESETQLRSLNRSLGNSDKIRFMGWREDSRKILKAFDIYVNTSVRESFGNVFIEAGHEGIPIIAPSIDGIPEAVKDNVNGILIKPSNPLSGSSHQYSVVKNELVKPASISHDELSNQILRLANSPELRGKLNAGGLKVSEGFTLEMYIKKLSKIYLTTSRRIEG